MTTKTDLAALTLTNAEAAACHAKAFNGAMALAAAKESAAELACQIAEILKVLPAGANFTSLTNIRAALL